jgi:hypothetical protein
MKFTEFTTLFFLAIQPAHIHLAAQNNERYQQKIENIIESLSESGIDISENEEQFIDPDYLENNKININTATKEEFEVIELLNSYQIAAIIDYRQTKGAFMSIYELLYIPGFPDDDILILSKYLTCSSPVENTYHKNLFTYPKQKLVLRYQRVLEKQEGYLEQSDTLLQISGKSKYAGSPDKVYLSYKVNFEKKLSAAIIAEKDPGEQFFKGSNKQGFDLYSAYISYSNDRILLKNILIGDFNIKMGQGLLVWSGFATGKSSNVEGVYRNAKLISGNTSAAENQFLRGISITLGNEKLNFCLLTSYRKIDAVIIDTGSQSGTISSLSKTGIHATQSELENEGKLRYQIFGSSLQYSLRNFNVGLNGIFERYSKSFVSDSSLNSVSKPVGNIFYGLSGDYRLLAGRAQFFGETAYSGGHFAFLNGCLLYINPEISIGILHRQYYAEYFSFLSNAFGENTSVTNENGFFIGIQSQFSKLYIKAYSDIFTFNLLKYRVSTPSTGYQFFIEAGYKTSIAEITFRMDKKQKPENGFVEDHLWAVRLKTREKYRLSSKIDVGKNLAVQDRLELTRLKTRGDTTQTGFFLAQDIILRHFNIPIEIVTRLVWFNAEKYETRSYIYERDISNGGIGHMLYGKGFRYMFLISCKVTDYLNCRLKIGQSLYPGKDTIGSGSGEISGNHKTELGIQITVSI